MEIIICPECRKEAPWLFSGVCGMCQIVQSAQFPKFKEMGVENPYDKSGSTAHVRDIKNRRLDPKTNKMFYYEPPKTYFFPKG